MVTHWSTVQEFDSKVHDMAITWLHTDQQYKNLIGKQHIYDTGYTTANSAQTFMCFHVHCNVILLSWVGRNPHKTIL